MSIHSSRRAGAIGVHSINRFVFTVPELGAAQHFYTSFGLDVRRTGQRLDLHTENNAHCWASIFEGEPQGRKRLEYLSFGVYEDDMPEFARRMSTHGIGCPPHPLSDGSGLWLRNPDGITLQLTVAPKVSPSAKMPPAERFPVPLGHGAAPARSQVTQVRPRALSHILMFTPDVPRMVEFNRDLLGLRLSDRSLDIIAFMHGAHGSDHHLVAYAKSNAPGLHHSSWSVGSIDEVGLGAEQMRTAGFDRGWGLGRHVLGSNYFHYVEDPWGSFAEFSHDIDFIAHDVDWAAADHPPEDSLYVWGPAVPDNFIVNHEQHPTGASINKGHKT